MTQTSLLAELRFDERVPNHLAPVWIKINRNARRYYLHRALAIIHPEGADRITKTSPTADLRKKTDTYFYLGEDAVYLRELKKVNPSDHWHMMIRVWAARILHPLLRLLPPGAKVD